MATRNAALVSGLLATMLGTAGVAGCGDDDATAYRGNGGAPNAGAAGKGRGGTASGGSSKGGMTGSAGEGGGSGIPLPQGGAGGHGEVEVGGAGGLSGAGAGGESALAPIQELAHGVFPQASDLRGLFFTEEGKLYASGHLGVDNTVDRLTIVARFNADGTPDTTFGSGGFLQMNLVARVMADTVVVNDGHEESLGIVELDNGDLVVQANVRDQNGKGTDVLLARITPAGVAVNSFGVNGIKRLVFGWDPALDDASWVGAGGPVDTGGALELDESSAEQKLVVAGFGTAPRGQLAGEPLVQRTDPDRYVVRVSADTGAIDPQFNAGKVFTYNSGGTFADNARRVLVEADGSIVSAGYANFGAGFGNYIVAIRLTPAGLLDPSFGFGIVNRGVLRSNPFVDDGGVAECYAIARQSNGRYVTTGYGSATATDGTSSYGYVSTTAQDLISIGFTPSGTAVDQSYGIRGTRVIQSEEMGLSSTEDRGRDVLVLDDDRIVHAGRLGPNPALLVVDPDGGYDTAIDVGQVFTYEPLGATTSHFYRVVLSTDGKRIAATTNNHVQGVLLAVLQVGDP